MWLVWIGLALVLLRFFEVGWFATLSWWWVVVPLALAFLWFEFIERHLGLEKKKAMDEMDALKQERIKRALQTDHSQRRPR